MHFIIVSVPGTFENIGCIRWHLSSVSIIYGVEYGGSSF